MIVLTRVGGGKLAVQGFNIDRILENRDGSLVYMCPSFISATTPDQASFSVLESIEDILEAIEVEARKVDRSY